MKVTRLTVPKLDASNAERFESAMLAVEGVSTVDTWAGRAVVTYADDTGSLALLRAAEAAGFHAQVPPSTTVMRIEGMTCRSCEITVERAFLGVAGVESVQVDAVGGIATVTGAADAVLLQASLGDTDYRVSSAETTTITGTPRAAWKEALGFLVAVAAAAYLLSRLGVGSGYANLGGSVTFWGAMFIGLVAGSSSCMAVSSGLLLSAVATYRRSLPEGAKTSAVMTPVALFVFGRIASYAALGALIGLVGSALTPSPPVLAAITIAASVYMIVAGMDMLRITPRWLARITPRMPKSLSRRILDAEGRPHPMMPLALGAATFFLPCGFTQALQLYALSTGSAAFGASVLAGFAIGTAPALLLLGWASGSLKGRAGRILYKTAGAAVLLLGVWNVQNGLVVAGYPLRVPWQYGGAVAADPNDPNVRLEGDVQVVEVTLTGESPYYSPTNRFTVLAGKPVRLVMHGFGLGCRSVFQIPRANVRQPLAAETNVVEFTPEKPGEYAFSCSMGMYPGSITAVLP